MEEFKVFDYLSEQVVVIDRNYRILYANEAYIKENGYSSKEEVIGQPCYRISHKRESPCEGECHPCPLKEIEKTYGAELLRKTKEVKLFLIVLNVLYYLENLSILHRKGTDFYRSLFIIVSVVSVNNVHRSPGFLYLF